MNNNKRTVAMVLSSLVIVNGVAPNISTVVANAATTSIVGNSTVNYINNKIMEENFDNIKNGELPEGWISEVSGGANPFKVVNENGNGKLVFDGSKSGNQGRVFVPTNWEDYTVEIDMKFTQVLNSSRWASIIFRAPEKGGLPYNQMAVRQDGSYEIAERKTDGNWNVQEKGKHTKPLDLNKNYKLKVRVCGNNVKEYIKEEGDSDYTLLVESWLDSGIREKGIIGFQGDQCSIEIDNLKVIQNEVTKIDANIPSNMEALKPVEINDILAEYNDGVKENVPSKYAKISSSDENIIKVEGNKVIPIKDGNAILSISYGNKKVEKAIKVSKGTEVKKVEKLSHENGYVLATVNEGINLKDITFNAEFNDLSKESITAEKCSFEDSTGNVIVKDGKLYVANKGVTPIKVKCDNGESEILIVSKNKDDKEYVLYEENFDKVENGAMPSGWSRLEGSTKSAVGVKDGNFVIDASKSPDNPSRVMLPEYLKVFSDYKITADTTFIGANEGTRWNSIMYRIQPDKNHYYQMAVRKNATASNGVEFAERNGSAWNVMDTASFTENIDSSKMYKYEIKTYGSRVQEFINDKLIIDTNGASKYKTGAIGLQANGSIMKVDNLKVTLQEESLPKLPYEKYVDVKEINEKISMAPTLGAEINSKKDLEVINSQIVPANVVAKVNQRLEVINESADPICTIDEFIKITEGKSIPVFEVKNIESANELVKYLKENKIEDVSVIATEGNIIKSMKDTYPIIRGILKFPYEGPLEETRMLEIVQEANRSKAKTVLLPASRINNEVAEYMQKRLVTVWGINQNGTSVENHNLITAGVNGVITKDFNKAVNSINLYDENTLVREPFIIGHRGIPSLAPENTLESAKLAYEKGANVVENDIYLTKDNEIVIMHDGTIDRTTNGTGNVEDYTLKELKEFKVNKQFPDKYPDARIPTLREYFEEFKDKDLVHFIEIKSYKPEIVQALKNLVKEMGVEDQIVVISFSEDQIKEMNRLMPEVSVGYLNSINGTSGDVREGLRKVFNSTQHLNATFNPSYSGVNKEFMEELKHRGMTVWPWTYRNENDFKSNFKMGTYGLTTDYSQWSTNLVTDIKAEKSRYYINTNQEIQLNAVGDTYGRNKVEVESEIIPVENKDLLKIDGNKIKGIKKGQATVLLKSVIKMDEKNSYTLYSEPITITIK